MLINAVAPFAGAWIEICKILGEYELVPVAPFAGAWIEIVKSLEESLAILVAPFAGAWIEIFYARSWMGNGGLSLPSRERGLKSVQRAAVAK